MTHDSTPNAAPPRLWDISQTLRIDGGWILG